MTLELYRRYKSPNILDQFYALGTPLYPVTRRNAEGVILFLLLSLSLFFFYSAAVRVPGVCNIPVYCAAIVVENKAIRCCRAARAGKKLKFDCD